MMNLRTLHKERITVAVSLENKKQEDLALIFLTINQIFVKIAFRF